jgi:hypothetical protein
MSCHCIAKVNKALAEQGASLVLPILFLQSGRLQGGRPRMLIRAENKKTHRPVNLTSAFCPVCGKKYDPEPVRPADPGGKARVKKVEKLGKERRKLRPRDCPQCKIKFQATTGKSSRCDQCGYWYHWNPEGFRWVKSHRATPPNLFPAKDD